MLVRSGQDTPECHQLAAQNSTVGSTSALLLQTLLRRYELLALITLSSVAPGGRMGHPQILCKQVVRAPSLGELICFRNR